MKKVLSLVLLIIIASACSQKEQSYTQPDLSDRKNVVFILSDDHRYDFMGFMGKVPFLETPNMDRMATEGVHVQNAFVSTSLCSPSRASILSGQYAHNHKVVDNQSLIPEGTVFFPEYLQKEAGYQTGFIGKWHMGEHHSGQRPGFDFWASFKGQGVYYNPTINFNGTDEVHGDSAYVTDVLTNYAIDFISNRDKEKPFFLYLSHKGVHADFQPAKRHLGKYEEEPVAYPPTMFPPGHERSTVSADQYNYDDLPNWAKAQRNSWHGVDYMYHGQINFEDFYRRYCETLLSVDESIGTVLDYLESEDLLENTVVIYMGDNGFSFGEHGLIDKRQAYEESMRVPMLAMGGGIPAASRVSEVVQNVDVGPTVMDLAGLGVKAHMDGSSFKKLLYQESIPWRDTVYYEYFWERPFPQTPTVHAVRTSKYKFIRYHGVWDINELYDIENDPNEMNNLIRNDDYRKVAEELRSALFAWLSETGGESMPLKPDHGRRFDHIYRDTY
ncbi:sulfatase [Marinoscillum sp. 108]|uniref:sulfatase family protein n=1 Tax=Marinoscillum sp. 108 TaxID=2653151 RepID=UPI0012EFB1A4|nr:sulfatase [Marinoscillum sp. 108]VXD12275.1 Acetylglucosamine-6-sulfatase [Marinoscillum sp. 108]